MDEILHAPQRELPRRRQRKGSAPAGEERAERLRERFSQFIEETAARGRVLRRQGTRVYHRFCSATAGKPKMAPLPFLAISAVIGLATVLGTLYTPAYVVTVDGADVGVVRDQAVFTQAVERVEARASEILGYDYTLDHTVTYSSALVERDELTPAADMENYLFEQIDAIMKSYVLTVDGQFVGAATDRSTLDALLEGLSAPYVNENTISVSYTKNVHITQEYVPSDVEQDTAAMLTTLTANTNGQTTYEVQSGDTFMALAFDNDMTMAEMEALNPGIDINKLYIGQILNIKEEIPFLGVETVDSLTNTNGQTTYEVQSGDTFMALAFDNDMTMAEMEALNPGIDINKLYIGQILNIKEEIPFLGVETVDSLTYTEAIECPVREVEDDSMYQGESKVLDAGVPGEALVTADVTYVNGVERERNVTSTTTIREATEKVIAVGTKERPTWYPTGNYIWPVYGTITSRFGYRYIFGSYSYHSGLDIAVPYGTNVKASDGGTVTFAGYKGSYGYLVIIDHGNGEQTYYGHNSSLLVSAGDKVYQGQTIAKAGSTGRSTGNHCHFEIRINGTAVNPAAYLN